MRGYCANRYGGENTEDAFRQEALHHKRGYKWLRDKQKSERTVGLTLMRRSSISTAGNVVTAMQMAQAERDKVLLSARRMRWRRMTCNDNDLVCVSGMLGQDLRQGYATKDPLVDREQQIATSVAAREFGHMLRGKMRTESFRISQDLKLLKQQTARLLDTGVTRSGNGALRNLRSYGSMPAMKSSTTRRSRRSSLDGGAGAGRGQLKPIHDGDDDSDSSSDASQPDDGGDSFYAQLQAESSSPQGVLGWEVKDDEGKTKAKSLVDATIQAGLAAFPRGSPLLAKLASKARKPKPKKKKGPRSQQRRRSGVHAPATTPTFGNSKSEALTSPLTAAIVQSQQGANRRGSDPPAHQMVLDMLKHQAALESPTKSKQSADDASLGDGPRELQLHRGTDARGRPRRLSNAVSDAVKVLDQLKETQVKAMAVASVPAMMAERARTRAANAQAKWEENNTHAGAVVAAVMQGVEGNFPSPRQFADDSDTDTESDGGTGKPLGPVPTISVPNGGSGLGPATFVQPHVDTEGLATVSFGDASEAAAGGGTTTNATGKLSSASRASRASESGGDAVKVSSSTSQGSRKKKGPQYNLRFVRVNHRTIPLDRAHSPARSSRSTRTPGTRRSRSPSPSRHRSRSPAASPGPESSSVSGWRSPAAKTPESLPYSPIVRPAHRPGSKSSRRRRQRHAPDEVTARSTPRPRGSATEIVSSPSHARVGAPGDGVVPEKVTGEPSVVSRDSHPETQDSPELAAMDNARAMQPLELPKLATADAGVGDTASPPTTPIVLPGAQAGAKAMTQRIQRKLQYGSPYGKPSHMSRVSTAPSTLHDGRSRGRSRRTRRSRSPEVSRFTATLRARDSAIRQQDGNDLVCVPCSAVCLRATACFRGCR